MDLIDELETLVEAYEQSGIEYAVFGPVAVAYHGFVRATVEVNLLVSSLPDAVRVAGERGFASVGRRFKKVEVSGEHLTLALVEVTGDLEHAWNTRVEICPSRPITIVSREALALTATFAGRAQDRMDLYRLEHPDEEKRPHDCDMSRRGLERRRETMRQLYRLAMSFRDARIIGPVSDRQKTDSSR